MDETIDMVGAWSGGAKEVADEMEGERSPPAPGVPSPRISGRFRQLIAAAVVSTLAFMFGMTVGWPSQVQPILQSEKSPVGRLSDEEMSWLASLTFLGGLTGPLFWSRVADHFGRKTGGYLISGTFLLGWALVAFTRERYILMVARFVNGIAGSGGMIIAPAYISETAHESIRGTLGSFVMLSLNGGILFAYTVGAMFSYETLSIVALTVPLIFFLLFPWIPETPNYLWIKDKQRSAQESLIWLRGGMPSENPDENLGKKCEPGSGSYSALVSTKGRRMGMMIGIALFSWQQLCGIVPILSYTSYIFARSGSNIPPNRATLIVGVIQLIASFVSSLLVDRCGRKMLLFVSYICMGIALHTLALYFYLDNSNVNVSAFSWIPVISLSIHVLNYGIGAGPIPYIVMSETLPMDIKGLAISIIILWGTLLAFLIAKIFPFLIGTIGLSGCLFSYGVFSFVGFLFTLKFIPETSGIPLQEILLRLNGYRKDGI